MKVHYLSCAETAKLIRAALKSSFPGVKFSVKSHIYSGGASINVGWMDGPTHDLVAAVTGQFQAGRFDGMIDMAIRVQHWVLPDGSVSIASNPGTVGSAGSIPAQREWMPDVDAKLVSFGADHVFNNRNYSEKFVRQVAARLVRRGAPEFSDIDVRIGYDGGAYIDDTRNRRVESHGEYMDRVFHRTAQKMMIA